MRVVTASIQYCTLRKCGAALGSILRGENNRFDRIDEYERSFAQSEGANFAVASSMARIALLQILQSLDLQEGDSILLSPVTIPEMLAIVRILKLKPVFVDFAVGTLFPCPEDLGRKIISTKPKVFLLTYLAGQIGDLRKIREICDRENIVLIQDATQANQCFFEDQPITKWAEFSIFSTCELKFVHAYRGAMICVNSKNTSQKLKAVVNQTANSQSLFRIWQKWFLDSAAFLVLSPALYALIFHYARRIIFTQDPLREIEERPSKLQPASFFGTDFQRMKSVVPRDMIFRASNFEANMGLLSLEALSSLVDRHRWVAQQYLLAFASQKILPSTHPTAISSYWRFPILLATAAEAARFQAELRRQGIHAERSGLSLLSHDCTEAKQSISKMLYLPCHSGLRDEEVKNIIRVVLETAHATEHLSPCLVKSRLPS